MNPSGSNQHETARRGEGTTAISEGGPGPIARTQPTRLLSIDALRGFVMFMMIFVNDLAGAGKVVPNWMVHFSDRHHGGSGMTFVDLVFPGFLFLVGMSIPFALEARRARGEPIWKTSGHALIRTGSLLWIGILMVHETPDSAALGWPGNWWCVLMYLSAIAAFCAISIPVSASPERRRFGKACGLCIRALGLCGLLWLTLAFRGPRGERILTLVPFSLNTKWYGILGLIAWAYLVTCIVFLVFPRRPTAILGAMTLLLCLFAADRTGAFEGFWLHRIVGIGGTLGSQAAISVGGLLLGILAASTDGRALRARASFVLWFAAGCAAAALLLNGTYGISKNQATPSWCLWACAITAVFWFIFSIITDTRPVKAIAGPLACAGQNVLLPYLISEMLPGLLDAVGLAPGYDRLAATLAGAISRSALCALIILVLSAGINRAGFRLKL